MANLYFSGPYSIFTKDSTIPEYLQNIIPSQSSDGGTNFRIKTIAFGDGYSQRSIDGINGNVRSFNLTFKAIRQEVSVALDNFFNGDNALYDRRPHEYFFWTPPPPFNEREGKFIVRADSYKVVPLSGTLATINVIFDEVFDP
jgi:phage-related protein